MHKPWLLRPFNLAAGTDVVGRISVTQTNAPEWPYMHQSWQQHVYEQSLFLFVCVCVMLRKSSSALFSCKLPLAQPQPQQRSRSVSHSSGTLALVLAPSDITVRSKKETQAAKRAAGITGSKRHHRLDWQGG